MLGREKFHYFSDPVTLIIESSVQVYNLKWLIDRLRKISKCSKCQSDLVCKASELLINGRKVLKHIDYCPVCYPKEVIITVKMNFLKDSLPFDIFSLAKK